MSWLIRDGAEEDEMPIGFDLLPYLDRQRAFSTKAFGPGERTAGVIDHIRKELREIELSQGLDIEEWVDVLILAFDGALRSGCNPRDIATALQAKLTKNEGRQWPDWRTADPNKAIEHVRESSLSAVQRITVPEESKVTVQPTMAGLDQYAAQPGPVRVLPRVVTEKRHTHNWVQHPTNPAGRVCGGDQGCGIEL